MDVSDESWCAWHGGYGPVIPSSPGFTSGALARVSGQLFKQRQTFYRLSDDIGKTSFTVGANTVLYKIPCIAN